MRSSCTATKSSPHLLHLEIAHAQQWRPSMVKINKYIKTVLKKRKWKQRELQILMWLLRTWAGNRVSSGSLLHGPFLPHSLGFLWFLYGRKQPHQSIWTLQKEKHLQAGGQSGKWWAEERLQFLEVNLDRFERVQVALTCWGYDDRLTVFYTVRQSVFSFTPVLFHFCSVTLGYVKFSRLPYILGNNWWYGDVFFKKNIIDGQRAIEWDAA